MTFGNLTTSQARLLSRMYETSEAGLLRGGRPHAGDQGLLIDDVGIY